MGQGRALKALGIFFLAMAVMTLVARAADTLTIAKVNADKAKSSALTYVVKGQGRVEAALERAVWVPEGLRVERVPAQAGSQVKAGEPLAQLNLEHLTQALEKKEADLQKLKNQRAQTKLEKQAEIDTLEADKDKKDEEKKPERERLEKAMKLALEAADLEIGPAEREIALLTQLTRTAGAVVAPLDGVVTHMALKPGETTTAAAAARVAQGQEGLRAVVQVSEEEAAHVAVGDQAQVARSGKQQRQQGQVLSVSPPDEDGQCQVLVSLDAGAVGQAVTVEIRKKSDNYRRCIPLSALHSDSSGDYVLVIRQSSGVLGRSESAGRVQVSVLDKDGERAAVEGALMDEDLVIHKSDKAIAEGDRVRRLTDS